MYIYQEQNEMSRKNQKKTKNWGNFWTIEKKNRKVGKNAGKNRKVGKMSNRIGIFEKLLKKRKVGENKNREVEENG